MFFTREVWNHSMHFFLRHREAARYRAARQRFDLLGHLFGKHVEKGAGGVLDHRLAVDVGQSFIDLDVPQVGIDES
jgi:hypothetical protein